MTCPDGLPQALLFGLVALVLQLMGARLADSVHPETKMTTLLLTSELYWFTVMLYTLTFAVVYIPQCGQRLQKEKAE